MERINAAIAFEPPSPGYNSPVMEEPAKITDHPNDRVRIVGTEDYKKAAECLAEAFLVDDVAQYFVHTEQDGFKGWTPETRDLHNKIMEYITYAHCLKGLVTTIGPNYDCVALWYEELNFTLNKQRS